jgi:hypothetical protein
MVVEHIEQYWCPSIVSDDLVRVVRGSDGPISTTSPEPAKSRQ